MMPFALSLIILVCSVIADESNKKFSSVGRHSERPKILDVFDAAESSPNGQDQMFKKFIELSKVSMVDGENNHIATEDIGTLSSANYLHIFEWGAADCTDLRQVYTIRLNKCYYNSDAGSSSYFTTHVNSNNEIYLMHKVYGSQDCQSNFYGSYVKSVGYPLVGCGSITDDYNPAISGSGHYYYYNEPKGGLAYSATVDNYLHLYNLNENGAHYRQYVGDTTCSSDDNIWYTKWFRLKAYVKGSNYCYLYSKCDYGAGLLTYNQYGSSCTGTYNALTQSLGCNNGHTYMCDGNTAHPTQAPTHKPTQTPTLQPTVRPTPLPTPAPLTRRLRADQ